MWIAFNLNPPPPRQLYFGQCLLQVGWLPTAIFLCGQPEIKSGLTRKASFVNNYCVVTLNITHFVHSGEKHCWSCRSVGYYGDKPCQDAAFSQDGSLLAVAYEQVWFVAKPVASL